MSDKPEVTQRSQGYIFHWPTYGITIKANRVQIHKSDGRVTGELLVEAKNGGGIPATIYPPTGFNFSADRTRKELAKTLSPKNTELPWLEMIDQLCFGVQQRVRQGEPVSSSWVSDNDADIKPPEYLINPLIIKNYPNVIFGDPGSLKSTFAIILKQVLALPWRDNTLGFVAPSRPIKTIYLDWETDESTIKWQTMTLSRGMNISPLPVIYRHCSHPLSQNVDELKEKIAEVGAEVAIIDSLGMAVGGDLNETEPALEFFAGLRELQITSLILAHNSKDRETKRRTIYGNQFYTAASRNIWEARKQQEANSNELDIALFHSKPPPFAGLHEPLGFSFRFDNALGELKVSTSNPKDTGEFLEQMGLGTRILEALKGGSLSVTELAEELRADEQQIRARLSDLKKKNRVTKTGDNYGLLYDDI